MSAQSLRSLKISRIDWVLLLYPVIVYALCIAFVTLNFSAVKQGWGRDAINTSSFLAFVLLGNFAHNFISFWQLVRVPEYRKWTRIYRWRGRSIWQIAFVTFVFISSAVFWLPSGFNVFDPSSFSDPIPSALIFLFLFINANHNLAQIRGIGIGLSHRYLLDTDEEKVRYQTYRRREDIFYRILLADWFVYFAWALLFGRPYWFYFISARVVFLIALYTWMIISHYRLNRTHANFKLLFHSRHLYRLFFGLHPILSFLAFGLHGADAMLTYWKAVTKSSIPNKALIKGEFIALYIGIGIYFFVFYRTYPTTAVINRLLASIFITHYVVEGFMYRMKDPTTRQYIGPLL